MPIHLILLDANCLLIPVQFRLDIYDELHNLVPHPWKIVVISPIIEELQKKQELLGKQSKMAKEIKFGLQILASHQHDVITMKRVPGLPVDDQLIQYAHNEQTNHPSNQYYIVSNDKALRKKAKEVGIRTIYLRNKKTLQLDT